MENKKLKIILSALLAVFVVVFGAAIFYSDSRLGKNGGDQEKEDIASVPEKILKPREELALQQQVADVIKSKDFSRCDEIANVIYKTVCVNNIALNLAREKQDVSYCQKIDNELFSIRDCESQIVFSKANEKEDINVCNEAEDEELRKQCQDGFWPSLSMKKGDIDLCHNIADTTEKTHCRDGYIFQNEFVQNVKDFACEKFVSGQVGDDCQTYKKNMAKATLDICANLKSSLFLNHCLMNNLMNGGFPR